MLTRFLVSDQVIDVIKVDGTRETRVCYSPIYCYLLSKVPDLTTLNADTYAWFATASYLPPRLWSPHEEREVLRSRGIGKRILADWNANGEIANKTGKINAKL